MSMIIAHNIPGMNTQRQFGVSARGMSSSMEKLSSGFKINTGKDDPAGLLISEKLRSQLNGITRAKQNTEEAMNVMGIAEGAMNEMNNILKKMKSLATHAANSGVTTTDQTEADQAELDSAIQTIDRIAQTTEFSGEKLLNGAKELTFDSTTSVKGTQQNSLLNVRESTFNQIFKRDGYSVSLGYTGAAGAIDKLTDTGSQVDFAKQATKAYLEIDTGSTANAKAQVDDNGKFTQEQVFTLTGSLGSRQFTFGKNSSVTDMVKDIHNTAGSTGVDAALIFNSDQAIKALTAASDSSAQEKYKSGDQAIFGSELNVDGTVKHGLTTATLGNIAYGQNTDGNGNVYIKYISDTQVELYKDSSMTRESLVGTANGTGAAGGPYTYNIQESNNSGLTGTFTATKDANQSLADLKSNKISLGGIEADSTNPANGVNWSGNIAGAATPGTTVFDEALTLLTGVQLGQNTDANGKLYFKTVVDANDNVQVFAYKDEKMEAKDMVAKSDLLAKGALEKITLNEVTNSDGTAGTGLNIILQQNGTNLQSLAASTTTTGNVTFTNLGARIFASEYGSEHFVKLTQDKGAIFTSYDSPGDPERTIVDAGEKGKTKLIYGQDATVSINGMEVRTNGLDLKVATQDIQADFTFNGGKVGSTTIAQVGYDAGTIFTKAGVLNLGENSVEAADGTFTDPYAGGVYAGLSGLLCNAGHNTNETIGDFQNGMQLQLGEGAGDQNRTMVSLKSMTTENLGRLTRGGYWDTSNPSVYTTKTFTLKDCLGGGMASLYEDPTLTMAVIDKAIDDVAGQRATMGAMQSNLLQTNANNLEVTLENITKTESGIRDADMASEMAEFTKNQVLQNAAMSMMSQANQQSQSALQLLQ